MQGTLGLSHGLEGTFWGAAHVQTRLTQCNIKTNSNRDWCPSNRYFLVTPLRPPRPTP